VRLALDPTYRYPRWCPRVHAPNNRIQRELKCDYLIESKRRNPLDCEPLCPWQLVDVESQEILDLTMLSSTATGKDENLKFYFDVMRFKTACEIYMIPQEEWQEALWWVRYALTVCNDPTGTED
jgi:hypothetical protein